VDANKKDISFENPFNQDPLELGAAQQESL
jgi:hypothetical protein